MAGLWGARMLNAETREKVARAGSDIVEQEPRDYWDYDQVWICNNPLVFNQNTIVT